MSVLDSYGSGNYDYDLKIGAYDAGNGIYPGVAQSFSSGSGGEFEYSQFYIRKVGSPTGNATAKLYAHSGTFGTDSKPTGSALATSDTFDVSTLTASYALNSLLNSGVNRFNFPATTNYCLAFEYSGGDASNYIEIGMDATTPTHAGNGAILFGASWSENFRDLIFAVEATLSVPMKRGRMFFVAA